MVCHLKFEGAKFISNPDTFVTDLIKYAQSGNIKKLKLFKNAGANLNEKTSSGECLGDFLERTEDKNIKEYLSSVGVCSEVS